MERFPIRTAVLLLLLISSLPACQVIKPEPKAPEFYYNSGVEY